MKESKLWFWHLISGLALIVLLGVHTVIQHFDSILTLLGLLPKAAWESGGHLTGSLNFQHAVLPRMQSLSMTVVYVLLVLFGLFHGLYGLRSMIYEFRFSARAKQVVGVVILIIGIAAAVYGVYTVVDGHLNPPLGG
jgi:succinate dehydrogenase hydrophobic anchor subunit